MRNIVFSIVLLFSIFTLSVSAEDIKGIVVNTEGNVPIPNARVSIFSADNLLYDISTDESGKFEISLAKGIYRIQVVREEYMPLEDSLLVTGTDKMRELRLALDKEPINLGEILIKARPHYIKHLEDGIVYNLSKDKYAQKDNLLNALNRIPLLMVGSDGTINVAGKSTYAVYLNGKPYNIANTAPAQVLRSIPSSTIKQVEVVMRPANRFGESVPVINIITKGKTLEGYHVNVNGMGATTPKATGSTSLLGIMGSVQLFAGYTYELWGQRNQQWTHEYNYGGGRNSVTSSDHNRMNRHTHTGRAMLQWDMDTLRQLYADFLINGINREERIHYAQKDTEAASPSKYLSVSDTWDAAMETNVIYSSRFRESNAQKWRIGYRFTINPDNRDFQIEDLSADYTSTAKTKGRLYTHNLQLFRRVNLQKKLFCLFTLNANIRKGTSTSKYANESVTDSRDEYDYTQILSSIDWRTLWYITKSNDLWLDATNKFEYANEESSDLESPRHALSYLPTLNLTWQPNWSNELTLGFSSSVTRPSLQMLNPFVGGKTNSDVLQGSPWLKDAKTYALSLSYSFYGEKLTVSPSISGGLTHNAIMSVFGSDETASRVVETYSNISKVRRLSIEWFLSYRPWQWMTLRNVSSFGIQNIVSSKYALDESNGFYQSTSVLTLNLSSSWKFETRFTAYKNTPKAWIRYQDGIMYGFSLAKTLMKGNMYVRVFADSPFDRHGTLDSRTILSSPNLSYDKLWKIQTRSVGIDVSINLHKGKKVGLKRNTSLKDTDIQSGIAN